MRACSSMDVRQCHKYLVKVPGNAVLQERYPAYWYGRCALGAANPPFAGRDLVLSRPARGCPMKRSCSDLIANLEEACFGRASGTRAVGPLKAFR